LAVLGEEVVDDPRLTGVRGGGAGPEMFGGVKRAQPGEQRLRFEGEINKTGTRDRYLILLAHAGGKMG